MHVSFRFAAFCVVAAALASPVCEADGFTQVQGTWSEATPGNSNRLTFSCIGTPTCSGVFTYVINFGPPTCSNNLSVTVDGTVTVTGLNLTQAGNLQGTFQMDRDALFTIPVGPPAGACSFSGYAAHTRTYTGTWDGKGGGNFFLDVFSLPNTGSYTASASAPPVFPMTVAATLSATTVNANATFQPRPQDVGTQGSLFVFAHVPSNMLKDARAKRAAQTGGAADTDGAILCVLAQVDDQDEFVEVTPATMRSYLTGLLHSQDQAVAILNNFETKHAAGAAFFMGYGPDAAKMLADGVYQGVITVPGDVQCNSNLGKAAPPTPPGALSGLWWNANESGWGIHFTQRGSNIFAAWYTYDGNGQPKWYVSTCTGLTGTSGICNGTLYAVVGPSFFGGGAFNPSLVNATNVGSVQINFTDANKAALTYITGGQNRTVQLTRQPLDTGSTPPAIDYTDLWWNKDESGWGMAMTQQYGTNFLAWYVYDSSGRPTWLVATCKMSGNSCSGTLYRTSGPPFGPTFNPDQVKSSPAGPILVIFTDANNAILNYTVDGLPGIKAVTRQTF